MYYCVALSRCLRYHCLRPEYTHWCIQRLARPTTSAFYSSCVISFPLLFELRSSRSPVGTPRWHSIVDESLPARGGGQAARLLKRIGACHPFPCPFSLKFSDRPRTAQECPDMTGAYILRDLNAALQLRGVVPVRKHLLRHTPAPAAPSRHAGQSSPSASSASQRRQKQRRQRAKCAEVDFSLTVGIMGRTREGVCRGGAAGTHEGAAVCLARAWGADRQHSQHHT